VAKIANGGPAYPGPGGADRLGSDGMTLRDWFAGKALDAIPWNAVRETLRINRGVISPTLQDIVDYRAEAAYLQADAMIRARAKDVR
jgi:hypothetical protein